MKHLSTILGSSCILEEAEINIKQIKRAVSFYTEQISSSCWIDRCGESPAHCQGCQVVTLAGCSTKLSPSTWSPLPSLRANKDYSLFTPFSNAQGNLLFLHQSHIPLGNGSAHHLMHVNANKTPILTLNGLKTYKTANAVQ